MTTLTAPIRWLGHTMRSVRRPARPTFGGGRPPGWYRDDGDNDGPGGVREPRRPKPNPPAGAMAIPEPSSESV